MIELIGYHGTTEIAADNIIRTNNFRESTKNTEWLGKGVYFFDNKQWAKYWANEQVKNKGGKAVVLQAKLQCEKNFYLDLADEFVYKIFNEEFKEALKKMGKSITMTRYQKQCLACDFYRVKHNIKIISFVFFRGFDNRFFQLSGFERPILQRQICVADKSCIFDIKKLQ